MRTFARFLVLLALATAAACGAARPDHDTSPRRASEFITPEEVQTVRVSTAHQLVEQLRPAWLRYRRVSPGEPGAELQVFRNLQRVGGVAALHGIPASGIISLEYVGPIQARSRLGVRMLGGAILVTTE